MSRKKMMMGFPDKAPKSGGYQDVKMKEGEAQRCAREDINANMAASKNKTKMQPNHVGGPYAST